MTIPQAIIAVMKEAHEPLPVDEIHKRIVERGLYTFKAEDPRSIVRGQIRRHCIGLDFPSSSPVRYFQLVDSNLYALASEQPVRVPVVKRQATAARLVEEKLPEEIIEEAHRAHVAAIQKQLKAKILDNDPAFFERLVLELLIKMGYGGSDPTLGIHTGRPGDGGIDGVINEDRLGLGKIYIQAKRYGLDREVKESERREFAGAMNRVSKGVFITTARFATRAVRFVEGHEKTISLIDGDMLSDLMIRFGVGVSDLKAYRVVRVDSDYFAVS